MHNHVHSPNDLNKHIALSVMHLWNNSHCGNGGQNLHSRGVRKELWWPRSSSWVNRQSHPLNDPSETWAPLAHGSSELSRTLMEMTATWVTVHSSDIPMAEAENTASLQPQLRWALRNRRRHDFVVNRNRRPCSWAFFFFLFNRINSKTYFHILEDWSHNHYWYWRYNQPLGGRC